MIAVLWNKFVLAGWKTKRNSVCHEHDANYKLMGERAFPWEWGWVDNYDSDGKSQYIFRVELVM